MINPVSALVLIPSVLVSLPALYSVWQGRMPFDVGLSRFLMVQLVCWLGLSAGARAVSSWWAESEALDDESGSPDLQGPEAAPAGTALAGES